MALQLFKIADVTVSSPQATILFTSIPQGYTDLLLKMSTRNTANSVTAQISFNGVTTNLTSKQLYGDGAAAGSTSSASVIESYGTTEASSYTTNTFCNADVYIPNYTSSNYKSVAVDSVSETNATNNLMAAAAGLWSSTAAITSITLTPGASGNFAANSTATLYGVL